MISCLDSRPWDLCQRGQCLREGVVWLSVKMGSRWLRGGDLWMNSGFVMRVCGTRERCVTSVLLLPHCDKVFLHTAGLNWMVPAWESLCLYVPYLSLWILGAEKETFLPLIIIPMRIQFFMFHSLIVLYGHEFYCVSPWSIFFCSPGSSVSNSLPAFHLIYLLHLPFKIYCTYRKHFLYNAL